MLRGSLHFCTLKVRILKVLTLCQSAKVKQRYLSLHIANLMMDKDFQSLDGFGKEICAMTEEKNYCSDCKSLFPKLPYDLFATDFVKDFISKTDYLQIETDLIKEIWMEPYSKYMEKHSEKICSFVCPNMFLI